MAQTPSPILLSLVRMVLPSDHDIPSPAIGSPGSAYGYDKTFQKKRRNLVRGPAYSVSMDISERQRCRRAQLYSACRCRAALAPAPARSPCLVTFGGSAAAAALENRSRAGDATRRRGSHRRLRGGRGRVDAGGVSVPPSGSLSGLWCDGGVKRAAVVS